MRLKRMIREFLGVQLPPFAVYISETVLRDSVEALLKSGSTLEHHEGVVYWAGKRNDGIVEVTMCLVPRASTTWGSYRTSAQANAEVIKKLCENGLELIAQVHSHPGEFVDHSEGDDRLALMPYEGFLSIVVPHYGRRGIWPIVRCGVHRFEQGHFRRLTNFEVRKGFHLSTT